MTEDTTATSPRTGRRAVLFSAGAVGATTVLAGCGDGDKDTAAEPTATQGGPATGAPTTAAPTALVKAAEVPVGGGVVLKDREVVVTQPTAGVYKGFSAKCTHQGCTVQAVTAGKIHCACHNSDFSITDGSVLGGPARAALPERTVKKDGDEIVPAP
ncbi:iron-sulfur protein [Pilimelia anulata]|uniref:Cytochrome bc1 complex Rieske iron-sulfur subunit n=1 Tax=Pilimelia anulata TaxID=53371 RepID=A0A8J3B2J5_9ACTN|nr:Rieske (2Fe-2S) protein [Pilimelia anulata]GGJ80799.1 iron-sulfur protein [Pilimelia anulata]